MQPQKCDLLGYLLGALDATEQQQVEQEIEDNPELEAQLMRLKETLQPIEDLRTTENQSIHQELPVNLSERTCHLIGSVPFDVKQPTITNTSTDQARVQPRIPVDFGPIRSSWSISDFIALAVVMAVISAIVIPAISASRYESRLTACQNNLVQLGTALASYQESHQMIVPVVNKGNRGVAGIYAPTLREFGYIEEEFNYRCPGRGACESIYEDCIPTLAEIDRSCCEKVRDYHQRMGGDYSYAMGYIKGDSYHYKRKLDRSCFVVMADNACPSLSGQVSSYHGGRGQNVLFGDLRVSFVSIDSDDPCFDLIYQNDNGITAAGIGPADNIVGRSSARPIPPTMHVRYCSEAP